jgi:hypothetical protein
VSHEEYLTLSYRLEGGVLDYMLKIIIMNHARLDG